MTKKVVLSEDWWSVVIGGTILTLISVGVISWIPKVGRWSTSPLEALSLTDVVSIALVAVFLLLITLVAIVNMEVKFLKPYLTTFPIIFLISFLGIFISRQETVSSFGVEYVIWALLLGLLMGNVGFFNRLRRVIRAELYIKIGLVLLGAEILFQRIISAGARGVIQALFIVITVWYFCYFLALKFRLKKSLAYIMSTGVSICGVSAAIAAGGAIKGDPKEVSYVVSMILLIAIPMLIIMPFTAQIMGLSDAVAGAWIGGTIDTTPAVVAAGALYSSEAIKYAVIVKLSQNFLIGFAAFLIALYWTLRVEGKEGEKPKAIEIWYRFPKFIFGFIAASLVFSIMLMPMMGDDAINGILTVTKEFRKWFFALAFTCIGLETKLSEWTSMGNVKPLLVFLSAQIFNIILTLVVASILFGGVF